MLCETWANRRVKPPMFHRTVIDSAEFMKKKIRPEETDKVEGKKKRKRRKEFAYEFYPFRFTEMRPV